MKLTTHHGRIVTWLMTAMVVMFCHHADAQERFRLDQDEWKQQTRIDPSSAQGQLQAIRKTLAQGDAAGAEKAAKKWIKDNPDSDLLVDAHMIKGDAHVAQREYFKSLFDYEYVIRTFPASEQYITANDREYEVAKIFASGVKRIWLGARILPASGEAEEIFIRIQERLPGSDLGEKASLSLADFYFNRREMTSATLAYDLFLQNYPRSEFRERAMLRLIHASLATFKGSQYDSTGLIDARTRIEQFESEYPASAARIDAPSLQVKIQELLALKHKQVGDWYQRKGNNVSANFMYKRVMKDYGDTNAAQAAASMIYNAPEPEQAAPADDEAAPSAPENAS